jgi:hypothetical protein
MARTTRTEADARLRRINAATETAKGTMARPNIPERGLPVTDKDRMAWQNRRNPF